MTYAFMQHYWWFIISLLGALLVFLMFVQGANSLIFALGITSDERKLIVNSTGRKWEITFTTLVTFGGAFFASFPLFYSTSFGGAYWLWMVILFSFVLQAVSYEFQHKLGNILGATTFQIFLVLNGIIGPLLLGGAVATFFNGSNFIIDKDNIIDTMQPIISSWANGSHGLDALLDPWNVVFGLAVYYLAQVTGLLYLINNINEEIIRTRCRKRLLISASAFLILFISFLIRTLLKQGFAVDQQTQIIILEYHKYWHNLISQWYLVVGLAGGVLMVLYGIIRTLLSKTYISGIWYTGIGQVITVVVLLLLVGWNNTAYYPSTADLQSSLTLANSCSSEFTLRTMTIVSFFIPLVVAYIIYAWRAIDKKKLDMQEIKQK